MWALFHEADISFFHDFEPPPTGGGHQFMRALQESLTEKGYRVENNTISKTTRACLFNSFNFNIQQLSKLRLIRPNCKMIHRVDGPISVYRGMDDGTDTIIHQANRKLADLTIFQSDYSYQAHGKLGFNFTSPHLIIPNSPDPSIFNQLASTPRPNNKIRLISTSWSDNPNKGADTYLWLDQNLDWNKFDYTFIGRIEKKLHNIKHIKPVDSITLASHLKKSDIFITASRHDPCSNALAEALSCGLPVIYLNSGGHSELAKNAGLPFNTPKEIPLLLKQMSDNYSNYKKNVSLPSLDDITNSYLEAMGLS